MKNTETGDQSGGLQREHGGSTPVKTGGAGNSEHDGANISKPTAESTEDKNIPGAFAQELGGSDDIEPDS